MGWFPLWECWQNRIFGLEDEMRTQYAALQSTLRMAGVRSLVWSYHILNSQILPYVILSYLSLLYPSMQCVPKKKLPTEVWGLCWKTRFLDHFGSSRLSWAILENMGCFGPQWTTLGHFGPNIRSQNTQSYVSNYFLGHFLYPSFPIYSFPVLFYLIRFSQVMSMNSHHKSPAFKLT